MCCRWYIAGDVRIVTNVLSLSTANKQVDAIHVTQLERDTVLVCLDRKCNLFSSAKSAQTSSVQSRFKYLCSAASFLQPFFFPQKIWRLLISRADWSPTRSWHLSSVLTSASDLLVSFQTGVGLLCNETGVPIILCETLQHLSANSFH